MSTPSTRMTTTLLLIGLLLSPASSFAAGTPGAGEEKIPEGQTADSLAVEYYEAGLAHKEHAWQKQAAASTAAEEDRSSLLAEAQTVFQAAVKAQGKALGLQLSYHQAANELGYALRQTGDYRKALGAYNFALSIKPDFYPAIEYRGEAYLALGMLDQAKSAYMTLFSNDPVLAAQLLSAMETSVMKASIPGHDTLQASFQEWVAERKTLAGLTGQIDPVDPAAGKNW